VSWSFRTEPRSRRSCGSNGRTDMPARATAVGYRHVQAPFCRAPNNKAGVFRQASCPGLPVLSCSGRRITNALPCRSR
jgi:hypothetical protein